MLLAENLLLLVTDDASGRLSVPGHQLDPGLGGANEVVDAALRIVLAHAGRRPSAVIRPLGKMDRPGFFGGSCLPI